MERRLLFALIALSSLTACNSSTTSASTTNSQITSSETTTENTLKLQLLRQGDSYSISSVTGEGDELIIPSHYEGAPIIAVLPNAFSFCKVRSVVLPATMTTLFHLAFAGSTVQTITLNEGLSKIENGSFSNCVNLESLVIPDSVIWIGEGAFDGCRSLKSVSIGSGAEFEETKLFNESRSPLRNTGNPFRDVASLESIEISTRNTNYQSLDGCLYDKGLSFLFSYPSKHQNSSYFMPTSLKGWALDAFASSKIDEIWFSAAFSPQDDPRLTFEWTWPIVNGLNHPLIHVPLEHPTMMLNNGVLQSKDGTTLFYCPPNPEFENLDLRAISAFGGYVFWNNRTIKKALFNANIDLSNAYALFAGSGIEVAFDGDPSRYTIKDGVLYSGTKIIWCNGNTRSVEITSTEQLNLPSTKLALANTNLSAINLGFEDEHYKSEDGVLYFDDVLALYPAGKKGSVFACAENTNGIQISSICFNSEVQKIVIDDMSKISSTYYGLYGLPLFEGFFIKSQRPQSAFRLSDPTIPHYYYSEIEPEPNNHQEWHYVNGEPVVW